MNRNKKKAKAAHKKNQQGKTTNANKKISSGVMNEIKAENANLIKNGFDENLLKNGLSEALLGFEPGGIGTQISQVDTMFKSNRWYLVSNMRQLLSQIYVEFGLVQTVVDVPVNDAFRGGVEIKTEQLDDKDIAVLQNKMEREGDLETVAQANKWNRLFGGAGIIIITEQDYKDELDLGVIKKGAPIDFRAVDMWELFWSKQNTDDYSVAINQEEITNVEFYDYYGKELHNSRVMQLIGLKAPSFVRPRLRGWGFSIMESIVRSINQYLKATDLTFEVLDEFKIDVYKIKGLAQTLLSPSGTEVIQRRVEIANQQKNYQSAITMDAEDDYQQKAMSFAGMGAVMKEIKMQLASDLRMPLTKLFGVSSQGFNSGEDDIENYNAMVESTVRSKTKFQVIKLIEIRCQQLFGFIPDDLDIDFKPLRVLSTEQEEAAKTSKFGRLLEARRSGEISSKEFKEGCNLADLLPVKVEANDTIYPTPMAGKEGSGDVGGVAAAKSTMTAPQAKNAADDMTRIGVIGLVSDGYVLTGQRNDNGLWTSPGGHLNADETPLAGAVRECAEECGIVNLGNKIKSLDPKVISSHRVEGKQFTVYPFIAELDSRIPPKLSDDPDGEIKVWRWVPISKETLELKPENRHAKNDLIVEHLMKGLK